MTKIQIRNNLKRRLSVAVRDQGLWDVSLSVGMTTTNLTRLLRADYNCRIDTLIDCLDAIGQGVSVICD